jgi:hypothetical protein
MSSSGDEVSSRADSGGSQRKDLQDLRHLPRNPSLSYLQKQAQPAAPRAKTLPHKPSRFPLISAFTPLNLWNWVRQYLLFRVGSRHPFKTYDVQGGDTGVYPLREEDACVRIALAGDWATGTDEAYEVGQRIKEFDPHYTVHLGDVYYVGTDEEVDENFLGQSTPGSGYDPCRWPAGKYGSLALVGNHEMYSRGFSYFDRMLPSLGVSNGGARQEQKASFFCLENDHWRIIGLDTGYNSIGVPLVEFLLKPDCALPDEVVAWVEKVVRPEKDDRGIILLSHHQWFSGFDQWYPKPAEQLSRFISRPVIWFWGHEHRFAIYKEYGDAGGLRAYGRCIGHGGMPVEIPPKEPLHPECPLEFVDRTLYDNNEGLEIGKNGFARLTLRGNLLSVEYVDLHGKVVFSENWEQRDGRLSRRP